MKKHTEVTCNKHMTSQTMYSVPIDRLIQLIYKKNKDSFMYARYRDEYYYAQIVNEQAVLWKFNKVKDWDCVLCADGSTLYKKRVNLKEVDKFFFAKFFVIWKDVLCKAKLTKNKKYIKLYLDLQHEEFAIANKFKWNDKQHCWILKIPACECERYIMKTLEVYPRINRKRIKNLSLAYWMEMYESLNWNINEKTV